MRELTLIQLVAPDNFERRLPKKSRHTFDDEIVLFLPADLERIELSRGGLLLFALLCGGDYNPGICGCGAETAYGLAKCGFGNQLIYAIDNLEGQDLDNFISDWRVSLRLELLSNSRGMLKKRQPGISSRITDTFPNRDIINLYTSPLTSWSSTPQNIPDASLWVAKEPLLFNLARFCSDNFHWDTEALLKKKFANIIWEGAFLQMIYSVSLIY